MYHFTCRPIVHTNGPTLSTSHHRGPPDDFILCYTIAVCYYFPYVRAQSAVRSSTKVSEVPGWYYIAVRLSVWMAVVDRWSRVRLIPQRQGGGRAGGATVGADRPTATGLRRQDIAANRSSRSPRTCSRRVTSYTDNDKRPAVARWSDGVSEM